MGRMMRTGWVAIAVAGGGLLMAGPAAAQMAGAPFASANGFQPIVKPDSTAPKATEPPPSALPGAKPGRGAAPADKSVADLAPNDALFDGINRGDIGEVRDAVNRGADIGARNVLGMTPLELSIDLSRNDITFMLLSLRGATGGALSAKAAAAAAPATVKPAKTVKVVEKRAAPKPAAPVARQYAISTDPGTPNPQVGFLGFGR
jgi:hypothetical protein